MTGALAALERIRRAPKGPVAGAQCELCGEPIEPEETTGHVHLVDAETHSLRCVCRPCGLLFDHPGAGGRRYRRLPDRWAEVSGFSLEQPEWDALQFPVGTVFVIVSPDREPAAFYPGPAGATESLVPLDAWERLVSALPDLSSMEAGVEAALFLNTSPSGDCFIVPVDACYELVGRLRRTWKGFDGGPEARQEVASFRDRVKARCGG